jgi:hypothetical protein
MTRKLTWFFCIAAMMIAVCFNAATVLATSPNQAFKATTIASGTFERINVFNHRTKGELPAGYEGNVWLSLQQTLGASDLYVQNNTWQPVDPNTGTIASTGWHTHPGHSLIIVTAGAVTEYDPGCTPHVYRKGDAFIDQGEGHVHIIRNESLTETASTIAVQLVAHDPNKQNRRIDAPAPEGCQAIF